MRPNPVKRSLAAGGTVLGTMFFEFATSGAARLAGVAGAQFGVFDMEHTGWGVDTIRGLMATSLQAEFVPLVRVPALERHFVSPALDVGAMGIMVPMVESAAQARRLVEYAKYPPLGRRGAAFGIAHDAYRQGDVRETMRAANDEQLLITQIETVDGVAQVEEIAAVDGVDVLWIGHFDLTASMGIPARFDHPDYRNAVERVVAAARRHGKTAGFMAGGVEDGRALLAQGFRMLAFSGDLWLYGQALRDGIDALREAAGPA